MKTVKSPTRITSVFAFIFSFVAMMCMFADAFAGESGCARGNVYSVMFALQDGYNVVWPLIIGFVCVCLVVLAAIGGFIIGEAAGKSIALAEIVLGVGAAVLFIFSILFYTSANPTVDMASTADSGLGAGSICVIVFSFLAAAFGAIDLLVHSKKN
ncbi:MAG: hypothetical protein IKX82_01135 [Bacilli bacterium]|nr:hypothetical protein [Bacilli bacterium]